VLEGARAIAEAARRRRQALHRAGAPVEHAHLGHDRRHLLAVGADVLDRRGAGRAGDAGEALDARQPLDLRALDDGLPRLAGLRAQYDRAVGPALELDAARGDADHGAVEALVGHDDVAAAREHEHRLAGGVGLTDGCDEVVVVRGLDEPAGRPAEPQRGQRGERRVGDGAHAPPRYRHPYGVATSPAPCAATSPTGQLTPVPPRPQ
jgi:hypothetical protein